MEQKFSINKLIGHKKYRSLQYLPNIDYAMIDMAKIQDGENFKVKDLSVKIVRDTSS